MTTSQQPLTSQNVRSIILEQSRRANVGHIGSALSIADLLVVLYKDVLNIPDFNAPLRDRFILSKGHAALALYASFYLKGWISKDQLNTYCADESLLGVHPEHHLPGIEFSTGSLGMGLSYGVGTVMAARIKNIFYRSFVLISDAELNEGSVWESVMFAGHHKLSNLTAIIDVNAQQALGYTKDVLDLSSLKSKWEAFGWEAVEVDGHNEGSLKKTFNNFNYQSGRPHVVIAQTTFGKGVSYMENKIKWHYWPMSEEEYIQAQRQVSQNL